MRPLAFTPPALALALALAGLAARAEGPGNLLATATVEPGTLGFARDGAARVARLVDGEPATAARFDVIDGEPVALLFGFGGGTVAPDSLTLTLSDDPAHSPPVRVDILASTVSPTSGFASLRSERVDPLKPTQQVRFPGAAATWILIRLFPAPGADGVGLADLSVGGREGPPETRYAFGESPAAALEILGAMRGLGAAGLDLTPEEAAIFDRAATGPLDHDAFGTVALLASGVTDAATRADYLGRLDALAAEAQAALGPDLSPAGSGAPLLRWLHERALTGGYRAQQTDLSTLLDEGVFNCVSSAVLFNAVAGRLGFDVRAIEVPDHAFSIVYDGLDHMDVETTTPEGFNPRREEVAAFESLTGFSYIPQSDKAKRREIDAAGLAALIYYNHGVGHLEAGRYRESLAASFRALSLDPGFASAATNALAALGRWSASLADAGRWEEATEVAAVGARLAPDDSGLAATRRAIWQRWAFSEAEAGRPEAALAVLGRAAAEVGDPAFGAMRAAVFTRPAERLIEAGDWAAALAATEGADALLDGEARADLNRWRVGVHVRRAHADLDAGRFDGALAALVDGLASHPGERDLERSALYLAQEWAAAGGYREGLAALATAKEALPQVEGLEAVAATYVRRHVRDAAGAAPLAQTFAEAQEATPLLGDEAAADLGAFVYETYGHARIDARDWAQAAAIYAEGRDRFPEADILARNARYVAQEWQRAANAEGGVDALSAVQERLRGLFPEFAVDPGFGEDEIVRQIDGLLRQGDHEAAAAALASAQLLIRPETYLDLQRILYDRRAQAAMEAGDWAGAAAVYAEARAALNDPQAFSNNVAYIAQEWTMAAGAAEGAAGIAEAMTALAAAFPGDEAVAGMGLRTLQRMVASDVEAGAFEAARDTIRAARSFLTPDEAGALLVTLHARAGAKAIDAADWPAALRAYAEGLAMVPGAQELSRNVPYVLQEWSRAALLRDGAAGLVSDLGAMREILPDPAPLAEVLEAVLGREVADRVDRDEAEAALDLIDGVTGALPEETVANLRVLAYDRWARQAMDREDWQEAVRIYDRGLGAVPESALLDNNRDYAASRL